MVQFFYIIRQDKRYEVQHDKLLQVKKTRKMEFETNICSKKEKEEKNSNNQL
jgi:hypothetical protein